MNTLKNKLFAAGLLLASSSFVCNFLSATSAFSADETSSAASSGRVSEDFFEHIGALETSIADTNEEYSGYEREMLGLKTRLEHLQMLMRDNRQKYNDFDLCLKSMRAKQERKKSEENELNPMTTEVKLSALTSKLFDRVRPGAFIYVLSSDQLVVVFSEKCLAANISRFTAPDPSLVCQYKIEDYEGALVGDACLDGWQDAKIDLSDEHSVGYHKALFTVPTGSFSVSVCIYDKETGERGPVYKHINKFLCKGSAC